MSRSRHHGCACSMCQGFRALIGQRQRLRAPTVEEFDLPVFDDPGGLDFLPDCRRCGLCITECVCDVFAGMESAPLTAPLIREALRRAA